MIRRLAIVLMLAGCSQKTAAPTPTARPTNSLEAAAIEAGMIPDPASLDITGLYARETDRVCIVPAPKNYRIGILVDYGEDQGCTATGTIERDGEKLMIDLPGAPGCTFDARFEGDRIVFPAQVPAACAKVCHSRASIAALNVERLSESASEASALRSNKGEAFCGG